MPAQHHRVVRSPSRRTVVAVLAAAAVALSVAVPAAAADSVPAPWTGSFQLTGGGWGHGHGLSQYGAQGAARRGQTAAQILAFYYPGTVSTTIASSTIRVRLAELENSTLSVSAATGLRVTSTAGQSVALPSGPSRWRLTASSTGTSYSVDSLTGTTWKHYTTLSGSSTFSGPARLTLWLGGTPRTYDGTASTYFYYGEQNTNVTTSIEAYVAGVVPYEMGGSFPSAALQAQAVAARSYGWYQRASRRAQGRPYDVWDSTADQVFRGPSGRTATTDAATAATALTVRTYRGSVIFAQFGSSDGGWTSRGSQPYLGAAADPWERYSSNPYQTWSASLSVTGIRSWTGLSTLTGVHVYRDTSSGGHVTSVVFSGTRSGKASSVTESGDAVRLHYGLRSTYFTLSVPAPPAAGDLAGSGRTSLAVWRDGTATFWTYGARASAYGLPGDVPVPGRYTAGAAEQLAVFRPSTATWYVQGHRGVTYGLPGDIPVPGNYDGTGVDELAVYRPSTATWYVQGHPGVRYGLPGDLPLPGDYLGTGRDQLAIYRPSTGTWSVQGGSSVRYGEAGDVAVPGDYTGEGHIDIAVFRPSTAAWYVLGLPTRHYGLPGDVPVAGDYLGTGHDSVAVWRPGTGYWYTPGRTATHWGVPTDQPVNVPPALRMP